ncbi:response regulator [Rhodoferax saidenbachensis]|uniref:Two-component system nitrate/nitrite response regulator NarL n=1 Tax=Rhodoferax saidenbachensis TaxID=1484693 RepID=A0ABU1ZV95_9BURK|nr:response regulator [Rhodoferax saidenbachensis]MDR7308785.1 two-component system nitrate/nitrite response regulator NarL [Rhodoferax saidenbachensis]
MRLTQLLVVDDHNLFRRGLIALLKQDGRFDVVGEAADMGQALRCAGQMQPALILLDNHLPGVRGIDGISALKQAFGRARILMLTVSENEEDLAAAMQAGADGYLLKTVESDQLCQAIVRVLAGEPVISPEMMTKFVAAFRTKPLASPPTQTLLPTLAPQPSLEEALSAREREILLLVAHGDSNKLIARQLDIAETTVKVHVQGILRKLQLSSRVQAAVYASAHGLV